MATRVAVSKPKRSQEKLLNSLYDNLDDEENDPPLPSESSRTQAGTARSHRWLQPSQSYAESQQHANYYSQPYFHGLSPNSAGPHTTFTPMAQLQGVDLSDVMKSQQAILKSQENIMKIVETVSARVGTLEKVLEKLPDSLSSSPDEKKRLPPELSKLVATIHNSFDENDQFQADKGSKNPANKKVKAHITDEISASKENDFSKLLIERAIQRYFESRRRAWRESVSDNQERVKIQGKQRRKRARRERMYDRRSKVVHVGEEAERWKKISSKLMSEESSDDELGTIIIHRPVWRSKTFTDFLKVLEERANKRKSESSKHVTERIKRVDGSFLYTPPPSDTPLWCIDTEWLKNNPEFALSDKEN